MPIDQVISSDNEMLIRFTSNENVTMEGFVIDVYAGEFFDNMTTTIEIDVGNDTTTTELPTNNTSADNNGTGIVTDY